MIRCWMNSLIRKLHLLPNGELLERERKEAEEVRMKAQAERTERLARAQKLKERIKAGEEDVPLSLDAFVRAAGINLEQRERADARERGEDDREY